MIRVVVSCFGGSRVGVDVASGPQVIDPMGSFAAPCTEGATTTTSKTFRLTAAAFTVTATPDAPMWVAVTVQEPTATP